MKRITALFLVVTMILTCCPIKVQAFVSEPGRVEGINYKRINENEVLTKEVVFQVGDYTFKGELTNGKQLSDEEVDEAIRKVMRTGAEQEITSDLLIEMEDMISDALRYDKSRYVHPRVILELALSVSGLDSAKEFSEMFTGEREFETSASFYASVLAKTALGKLFDMALGKAVGEPLAKLLGAAKNVAQTGSRELFEYVESEEKLMRAMAAAVALEKFYTLCNQEIEKKEKEDGESTWKLTCNQTVSMEKSFFGLGGNTQFCRLDCDLERTAATSEEPADWGGRYEGSMKLEMWHDLSSFDEGFKEHIFLSSSFPFNRTAAFFNIEDLYSAGSELKKKLTNNNFSILLQSVLEEGGTYEKTFSWNGFEDRTSFWSFHHIRCGLDVGAIKDGHFEWSGGGAHTESNTEPNYYFAGEVNGNNQGVHLDVYAWNLKNNSYVAAPYFYSAVDGDEEGSNSGTIATDNQIFDELRTMPSTAL